MGFGFRVWSLGLGFVGFMGFGGLGGWGFGGLGVWGFRCSGAQGWMKMVWDESVIGRNRFRMKVSLDETVFG